MLSIIIPTREEARAVADTITQFKTLSIPHEIIVSDDGSSDNTVEVARAHGARVIEKSEYEKRSPARARNAGARATEGEILMFIDSSVEIPSLEAFVARALSQFEKDAELVALTGPQRAYPRIETWSDRVSFGIFNVILRIQNNIFHKGEASGKLMIVRREAFEHVGGLREDLVTREDGDFFERLSHIGRTHFDPELMIYHAARRAHAVGWARLWWIWIQNIVAFAILKRPIADDWTPVR